MMSSPRELVTIAELKRHMDRRFDRLERTKADRRDLRRFATKKDLRRFATKKEMRLWTIDIKRHVAVLIEGLEEQVKRIADGVARCEAIELRQSHYSKVLDDHETRLTAVERIRN